MLYRDRYYKIEVGQPYQVSKDTFSPSVMVPTADLSFANALSNTAIVTNHNIKFNIIKNSSSNSTPSTIEIYNCSDDGLLAHINKLSGLKPVIEFTAGHKDKHSVLFKGQVESFTDVFQGNTRVTTLFLGDSSETLREAKVGAYYPAGTPLATVVDEVLGHFGVVQGAILTSKYDVIESPFYAQGTAKNVMKQLCDRYDYRFCINDNKSYFVPKKDALPPVSTVPLSSNNGLISDVSPKDSTTGLSQYGTESKKNISFQCLLNGDYLPEYQVDIDTPTIKGSYKIVEVSHSGEFEGNDWYTSIVAEEI